MVKQDKVEISSKRSEHVEPNHAEEQESPEVYMKTQGRFLSQSRRSAPIFSLSFLILTLVFAFLATLAHSAEVTLAWDPNTEPDLAGYRVYYDTDAGPSYEGTGATEGDSWIDVGNVTEFTVGGLTDDITYFFVVTAYDTEGNESDYSNEVGTGSLDNTAPMADNGRLSTPEDTPVDG